MKVISVERMWSDRPEEALAALASDRVADPGCLRTTVIADSAIVRRGMPLFVPDFAEGWEVEFVPAVVISRLGKSIPPRFASRYYREVGVMGRLVPPEGAVAAGGLGTSFDGALCAGVTLPAERVGEWTVSVDGSMELTLGRDEMLTDETIALVSRYMMLKTGDVVIPCATGLRVRAEIGSRVRVTLNGEEAMMLKIK